MCVGDLVDCGTVLQAVVKRVSGQTRCYRQHGQDTTEKTGQNQELP